MNSDFRQGRVRLGDLLIEAGLIDDSQLQRALQEQKRTGVKLGRAVVDLGFISETRLLKALSEQLRIPFVELSHYKFDTALTQSLPEAVARRFRVIVLSRQADGLLLGMADPLNLYALDEAERLLGKPVYPAVVLEADLLAALERIYRRSSEIASLAGQLEERLEEADFDFGGISQDNQDAPVVRLLQTLFEDAVQTKASDIHIEPDDKVLRLLDQSAGVFRLDGTGMPVEMLERFRQLLRRPHGLVLVTGPTGSGKTTTLYAGLSELNSAETKIITVEDPVEYRLPRVSQVQVNPKIELTFARVLRAALRQDPDIVLVGEIRDGETAEIALRAALTGHLVLSTLHTNDALTSPLRLIDMGAEPFLVANSLNAVLAQRLVRRVCEHCRETHVPEEREQRWLEAIHGQPLGERSFMRGSGCHHCHNTGYLGRIGVYELLEISAAMAAALRRHDAQAFVDAARQQPHYRPLAAVALDYALAGLTSIDEVFRVSASLAEELD